MKRNRILLWAVIGSIVAWAGAQGRQGESDVPDPAADKATRSLLASSDQEAKSQIVDPNAPILHEKVDVRLVRMPVLAFDRHNRPITDLRQEDLQVKYRGRAMEVAFLDPFVREIEEEAPLPSVRLHVFAPGGGEAISTSKKEETQSILFLIDVENDQKLGKGKAAQELVRFIDTDLDPSYRAAVLSFNGKINVEASFTSDHRELTRAVVEAFERPPRPQIDTRLRVSQLIDRIEDCIVEEKAFANIGDENCLRTVALEYADENRPRSKDFLGALEGVVAFAGGLEGRKSVMAISHGVMMNPAPELIEAMKAVFGSSSLLSLVELDIRTGEGMISQRNDLLEMAIENQVTLHFIDRTLEPPGSYTAREGKMYFDGARPIRVAFLSAQLDVGEIAAHTGGVFVADTDLRAGVAEAMKLEQAGYTLGFYIDHFLPADELAKISVKTSRKGVRLSHRRGVFAKILREHPEFGIRGRVAVGQPTRLGPESPRSLQVPFQLIVEPRSMGYVMAVGGAYVTFTLDVVVLDSRGRRLTNSYHIVEHGYPLELWRAEDIEPMIIEGWVELPVGEFQLIALLRNPKTRQEGRLERKLRVDGNQKPGE